MLRRLESQLNEILCNFVILLYFYESRMSLLYLNTFVVLLTAVFPSSLRTRRWMTNALKPV